MKMIAVESSTITSIGYEPKTKELHIKFKQGQTYKYQGLKPETYKELMETKSQGKYFHAHIREAYPTTKL